MDPIVNECKEQMEKTVRSLHDNFSKLRSAQANPQILAGIKCDYYGDKININEISAITRPEPRQLMIKPYSSEDLKPIAAAITAANIGINPQVEADCIRLIFPPMTEDTRRQTVKQAKGMTEDAKVALRNIRRDHLAIIKEDDTMSDDYRERVEKDLEKVVSDAIKMVDDAYAAKEKEIMTL
ncbi:MAG: ribosome recycling factor [Bacilli bacterium]|nr:ribosome recycling factor [Bacilli bacterium]